jgi:hypothetical protein
MFMHSAEVKVGAGWCNTWTNQPVRTTILIQFLQHHAMHQIMLDSGKI